MAYTAMGKLARIDYGNGTSTQYDYYDTSGDYDWSAGTDLSYHLKAIDGGAVLRMSYGYDKVGNVKVKSDLDYSTEEFTYDEQDRLTGATSELYEAQSFAYDAIDNMTVNCGRTYLYESGRPHAVTSDGTYSYTYDANGNMASRSGGRSFSYDYDNRVSSVSDGGSYGYDASGGRVKKVEGGVTTYYFFPGYQEEWPEQAQEGKVVRYYFAEKLRVAQRNEENGLLYLHTDHLGSSVRMTSGNAGTEGEVVRALAYKPYGGDALSETSASDEDVIITDPITSGATISSRQRVILEAAAEASGQTVTLAGGRGVVLRAGASVAAGTTLVVRIDPELLADAGVKAKYRFTGQEKDGSGLYYYGARYYDPELGRFVQPDTVLAGLNRYAYCENNPIKYIDPSGHDVLNPGESGFPSVYVGYDSLAGLGTRGTELGSAGSSAFHSAVVTTDAMGNMVEIFESGPVGGHNSPITDGSYESDRFQDQGISPSNAAGEWERQFDGGVQLVSTPEGMTPSEFQDAVRREADAYTETDEYDALAPSGNGRSNSNSYAGSIVRGAGASDFEPENLVPGWNTGVTQQKPTEEDLGVAGGFGDPGTEQTTSAPSESKVICAQLHRAGLMDEDIYRADEKFGEMLRYRHPTVLAGYHAWARPVVGLMRRSQVATAVVAAAARPWSLEMAHQMGERARGDVIGKVLMAVGWALSWSIGIAVIHTVDICSVVAAAMLLVVARGLQKRNHERRSSRRCTLSRLCMKMAPLRTASDESSGPGTVVGEGL